MRAGGAAGSPTTHPTESLGGFTVAALLPVADTHDVLVHGAGNAVVVLGVKLGHSVHCREGESGRGSAGRRQQTCKFQGGSYHHTRRQPSSRSWHQPQPCCEQRNASRLCPAGESGGKVRPPHSGCESGRNSRPYLCGLAAAVGAVHLTGVATAVLARAATVTPLEGHCRHRHGMAGR